MQRTPARTPSGRSSPFIRLGRWLSARPRSVVLAIGIAAIAAGYYGASASERLEAGGLEAPGSESDRASKRLTERLGVITADVVAMLHDPEGDVRSPQFATFVLDGLEQLLEDEAILGAVSHYDTGIEALVSRDGRRTLLLLDLAGSQADAVAVLPRVERALREIFPGVEIGGQIPAENLAQTIAIRDIARAEKFALPLAAILTLIFFRSVVAALLPIAIGSVAMAASAAEIRALSSVFEISVFALNVSGFLGLGLAIDYALLTVQRFREELARSASVAEAIAETLDTAGRAVWISGLTVMVSLVVLFVVPLPLVRSVALGGILAVANAVAGALLLLPALLTWLGTRVNRLALTRATDAAGPSRAWERIGRVAIRRPWITAGVCSALLVLIALPALRMRAAMPSTATFPRESEVRRVDERISDPAQFDPGSASSLQIVLETDGPILEPENLRRIQSYLRELARVPGVAALDTALDALDPDQVGRNGLVTTANPDLLTELDRTLDGDLTLINARGIHAFRANAARDTVDAVRALPHPGRRLEVTGPTAALADARDALADHALLVGVLVVAWNLAVLFAAFRSVLVPLQAAFMNALSLAASFGVLVWVFQDGNLASLLDFTPPGGIEPTVPMILAAVIFGLSMDYEVFLLSRIQEEYRLCGDNSRSIVAGLAHTGRVISSAALILLVVIAAFAAGELVYAKEIGVGLVAAIALDVTLVRALLVPATMRLIGRWNWWAPRWLGGGTAPTRKIVVLGVAALTLGTTRASAADAGYAPDVPEPGSIEAIAAATTDPKFLSPWVSYVPESPDVPSPSDFLGHIAGAPGELSRTRDVYGYFRALADASPRVVVETIGKTEEGRDIILAAIADEGAIAALSSHREATARLADPRGCDERCMEAALETARPIYYLNGGLHSTETGSPEMLMELAYRLAVSEQPLIRSIRERVIVLINPVSEPDGRDRAVDWYYRFLVGKTDYDDLPEISPPFWGRYAFHDNNRDSHQRALALTRAVQDTFFRWHPQVVHDLHESIPLLLVWTGTGPYNVNMDPILVGEWQQMAFNEVRALSSLGMPGVWTWGFGEGWGHMFLDSVAVNHNAIGRGYETFGIGSAETMDVRLDLEYEEYADLPVTRRTWYRPWPPPRSFRWSLRNNTNYMQTGVLSILHYTSLHGEELLRDFWRKGKRAIELGASTPPYAFAIPEDQPDRGRLAAMINLLREHGIEVSRAESLFAASGRELPAGTLLVRMDQPYRGFALDLLAPQQYPADEAPYEPYDDVSWALPIHFGVEAIAIDDPAVRRVEASLIAEPITYPGRVEGSGPVYLLRDTGQEALLAARQRLAGYEIDVAEQAFEHDGREYPAGSWVMRGGRSLRAALAGAAAALGVDFESAPRAPDVAMHPIDLPRLAVLNTWNDTQAAGWVRMLFDQQQVHYELINDDDVKRGRLDRRFDVILYPHTTNSLRSAIHGIDPKHGPMPYTHTREFPSHGTPDASPDITGGLTFRGIANLQEFVERGGVLVTLGGASHVAIDAGLARGVSEVATDELHTPGVELRARFRRPDHPIAYGYPVDTSVFRQDLAPHRTREADLGWVVLQWGSEPLAYHDEPSMDDGPWGVGAGLGSAAESIESPQQGSHPMAESASEAEVAPSADESTLVVSGGMTGEAELEGLPAILDISVGRGRLVAFGFDPIHRTLARSDFRLVWNALLNWNDLPAPTANPPAVSGGRSPNAAAR